MIVRLCRLAVSLSLLSHSRLLRELGSRESPRCSRRNSEIRQRSHPALHHRPRPVPPADLHHEQGSAGVFRPGLPDDVRVRAPRRGALVPRGVEARSRLRHLLLGRRLGVGLVLERPDVGRAVAVCLRRHAEGDQPEGQGVAEGARVHRRAERALRQGFRRRRRARNRTRPTPTRWPRSPRSIPTISTPSRCTPTRCSCSSRAAARATSTRRTSSGCTACSNRR